MRKPQKKGQIIPKGTEQETGLTRGETEKQNQEGSSDNDIEKGKTNKPKIIPPGTEQETGLNK